MAFQGLRPLHHAVLAGRLEVLSELLKAQADVDARQAPERLIELKLQRTELREARSWHRFLYRFVMDFWVFLMDVGWISRLFPSFWSFRGLINRIGSHIKAFMNHPIRPVGSSHEPVINA